MPPLLCLAPVLLDQSFPRNIQDVEEIGIALGEIQELLERNEVNLVITDTLREFVELFEWDRPDLSIYYGKLQMVSSLLNQFFLQPHERLVTIQFPDDLNYSPHPVPDGTENQGLINEWSIEVGKLYAIHESCSRDDEFFIGVACESAFCDGPLGKYINPDDSPCFPLIGPENIHNLSDAYTSDIPRDFKRQPVGFNDAYKNCPILGTCILENPKRGSHYKVRYKGASRPWPLDKNDDPIPEKFLKELICILNNKYNLEEIIFVLITGNPPPPRKLKISMYCK